MASAWDGIMIMDRDRYPEDTVAMEIVGSNSSNPGLYRACYANATQH